MSGQAQGETGGPTARTSRERLIAGSVEDLTRQNVERIQALEQAEHRKASTADRVADAITRFSGSIGFVWINLVLVGGWMAFNLVLPSHDRVDPFPFPLLTLVLSIEAIFLSIFIFIFNFNLFYISPCRTLHSSPSLIVKVPRVPPLLVTNQRRWDPSLGNSIQPYIRHILTASDDTG